MNPGQAPPIVVSQRKAEGHRQTTSGLEMGQLAKKGVEREMHR